MLDSREQLNSEEFFWIYKAENISIQLVIYNENNQLLDQISTGLIPNLRCEDNCLICYFARCFYKKKEHRIDCRRY